MPTTKFSVAEKYQYQNGFGSYHECDALRVFDLPSTALTSIAERKLWMVLSPLA